MSRNRTNQNPVPPLAVERAPLVDAWGRPVPKGRLPLDAIVRVSKVGDRTEIKSPEQQEADIRRFVKTYRDARGRRFYVRRIHHEIDESGRTTNRPGLNAAKEAALAGEVEGIVAAYLSRFSRNVIEGLKLIDDLTAKGKLFLAPDAPFDPNEPTGRMMLTILLAIAQQIWDSLRAGFLRNVQDAVKKNGVHLQV